MIKPNEQARIALLKSVRNSENDTIIDQAIKDGMTLEELAQSMIKNRELFANEVPEVICVASTNAQRIADLDSIRMPSNSHLIDAAIQSGQTAGQVALSILNEEQESEKNAKEIAQYVNDLRHAQNKHSLVSNQSDEAANANADSNLSPEDQANADGIIAEMNNLRNQKNGRNSN